MFNLYIQPVPMLSITSVPCSSMAIYPFSFFAWGGGAIGMGGDDEKGLVTNLFPWR